MAEKRSFRSRLERIRENRGELSKDDARRHRLDKAEIFVTERNKHAPGTPEYDYYDAKASSAESVFTELVTVGVKAMTPTAKHDYVIERWKDRSRSLTKSRFAEILKDDRKVLPEIRNMSVKQLRWIIGEYERKRKLAE